MSRRPTASVSRAYAASVDVAILGARMHYAVPRTLAQAGLLGTFFTDTYVGNKPLLRALLNRLPAQLAPGWIRKLKGREAADVPMRQVVSFDRLGLKVKWAGRHAGSRAEMLRLNEWTARRFCELVARSGLRGAVVYALNGAALEIFREARRRGITTVLEQIIAPAEIEGRLLNEEVQRWPGVQDRIAVKASDNPLLSRVEMEWKLADCIVCGSEFVAAGLESLGVDPLKCRVVPYGVDTSAFQSRRARNYKDPLRVLFVGTVGLRKGIPYLLEAMQKLQDAPLQCRIVGQIEVDHRWLRERAGQVQVIGPVPRAEIIAIYDWADVFVLPSICEGSATVIYEALACGLPVITTPNSGSVVRDGKEGFVIPIRDADALAARIRLMTENRSLIRIMASNARRRSEEFDLQSYGQRLVSLVESLTASCRRVSPSIARITVQAGFSQHE